MKGSTSRDPAVTETHAEGSTVIENLLISVNDM